MEIVPVFISVDPERDNVEQIHDYVNGLLSLFLMNKRTLHTYTKACIVAPVVLISNCTKKSKSHSKAQVAT